MVSRPESSNFTDNLNIKADNHTGTHGRDHSVNACSQSEDLYSPQRRFDLDVDHNARATAQKFNAYQDNQTS